MRSFLCFYCLLAFVGLAQTGSEASRVNLTDLPSTEPKGKFPGEDQSSSQADFSNIRPAESPSIPQLRPAVAEPVKSKATNNSDWAAQAMLQKKEEAKKQEQEQADLAEKKARETQANLEKEKEAKVKPTGQPSLSASSVPGFEGRDVQKLPVVTGLEGVQPRAMASGDGRVQPAFNSFTGPASAGPLGKDFQSGARPIMSGTGSVDGRMQVPSLPPEPPSGAYKKISQDPYSMPALASEKTPALASSPKPLATPPNPPSGDPKRVIDNTKAGLSPYDNSKVVPDPRSQRRF